MALALGLTANDDTGREESADVHIVRQGKSEAAYTYRRLAVQVSLAVSR